LNASCSAHSARTHRSLRRLENALQRAGHRTWAGTYPSRARGIGALAAETAARIRAEAPAERYSAVTHSLGGILVRHMAELLPWRRVVMIAPPNAGSRVGRVFREHPLYRWFYGPAGLDVTEAEAWPNAQALTSCANSVIRPSFTTTSTVTVDPHRGERFFALPIGVESRP
jgi:pimeloyl-ACP methyl ester carboxylesterase